MCMCALCISDVTHFAGFRGWKLTISEDFVWRTHILLLDPRDSHVASLLRMPMVTHLNFYICVYYHIYALPQYHITTSGIVMPMNNDYPLINIGKDQEPMDSWAFPFSSPAEWSINGSKSAGCRTDGSVSCRRRIAVWGSHISPTAIGWQMRPPAFP